MTPVEFQQYVRRETAYSPVFKIPVRVSNQLTQEIIVDPGAECNVIDMENAQKIIESTGLILKKDRNYIQVSGVAGTTNILGYLQAEIYMGQGCICEDIIYVLSNVLGGGKFLLGKLFLAQKYLRDWQ
jgi:hypothetical protein